MASKEGDHQGWLQKRGHLVNTDFKRRYFVLKDGRGRCVAPKEWPERKGGGRHAAARAALPLPPSAPAEHLPLRDAAACEGADGCGARC